MAKLKADWVKEAKALGLEVNAKMKVAEIKEMVEAASDKKSLKESGQYKAQVVQVENNWIKDNVYERRYRNRCYCQLKRQELGNLIGVNPRLKDIFKDELISEPDA